MYVFVCYFKFLFSLASLSPFLSLMLALSTLNGLLTFSRSVQHGIAAKMSNEYIVPISKEAPSHFSVQKLCK